MNHQQAISRARKSAAALAQWIGSLAVDPNSSHSPTAQKATQLARLLQQRAVELQTPQERRQQAELDRMIQSPHDKATLVEMTDQAFRSRASYRTADQLTHILDVQGVPRFFSPLDRALLKGFQSFGNYLPGVAVPLVKSKMHRETANVILPAEPELLAPYLQARQREGVRMNVNFLGEALLGEGEAQQRLQGYLQALARPEIEVLSVKISTIYSQISSLARQQTIDVLCERLESLYRAAAAARFVRNDGSSVPKFVYLDMEEYRDMSITAEVFMQTLSRPGLQGLDAGIALQAYIPDSFVTLQRLAEWARRRAADGGSRVTIRIVKGANLEMERVEAALHGWPLAPYEHKIETDANYKRMLHEAMRPENSPAIRIGVASHNLFDVAYALVLAVEHGALDRTQFEMLEGMANHQRRALLDHVDNMLLYAPACRHEHFLNAIGYLIRRLDENTGPDNFLRHAFRLRTDSPDWKRLEQGFLESLDRIPQLSAQARRTQDRRQTPDAVPPPDDWRHLANEPDTDWSLPQNAEWARDIIAQWQPRSGPQAIEMPLVIGGKQVEQPRPMRDSLDPSRPGVVVGRFAQATVDDVAHAVACAHHDPDQWRAATHDQRAAVLHRVAQELRRARGDLMGAAMADGGKTFAESDPEVSEAIDFVEFYTAAAEYFHNLAGLAARGRGVVAVVSPWNFPIAIPCGGVAAALAAGNTVILKPSSDTVLVAHELCQCFYRAGISPRVLQLLPCTGEAAQALVTHQDVDTVILTGGTATAMAMLRAKPTMHLLAETGGKNATIVTALSDRELAIADVVHSAFSHSGQKCSATSLLILEDEVYDDPAFRAGLCDAVESLQVGAASNLAIRIGPLIRPPTGELQTALTRLEPGQSWAVEPRCDPVNPNLWSPGVLWDVAPGSVAHTTEFFGPVLAVMRARNLDEAIELVNATGYGLTSGLESLDDREQQRWRAGIRAGNLYINRPTTGAIVLRQPFGGMGKSAFGPGIKAGGPNYVAQLMRCASMDSPPLQGRAGDGSRCDAASAHSIQQDSTAAHIAPLSQPFPEGERSSPQVSDPLLEELRQTLENLTLLPGDLPLDQFRLVAAAIVDYDRQFRQVFRTEHDYFRLLGQDNLSRYLPAGAVRLRVDPADSTFEIFARLAAARVAGCRTTVSLPPDFDSPAIRLLDELTEDWGAAIELVEESDEQLRDVISRRQADRLRYAAADRVPLAICEASAQTGIYVADAPVLPHGRIELLWYLREQSLSLNYHRYGNLGSRAEESRARLAQPSTAAGGLTPH